MADIWKTELHICNAAGDAFEWLDEGEEEAAIAAAREVGGRVIAVTEYHTDREEIFNAADEAEDEE